MKLANTTLGKIVNKGNEIITSDISKVVMFSFLPGGTYYFTRMLFGPDEDMSKKTKGFLYVGSAALDVIKTISYTNNFI